MISGAFRFIPKKFYKHKYMTDVYFEVVKAFTLPYNLAKQIVKLKIVWHPSGFSDRITVDRKDFKHYMEVSHDTCK